MADTKYIALIALVAVAFALYRPRRNPNANQTPPPSVSQLRPVKIANA